MKFKYTKQCWNFIKPRKNPWNYTSKFPNTHFFLEIGLKMDYKFILNWVVISRSVMSALVFPFDTLQFLNNPSKNHFSAFSNADYNRSLEPIRKFITNSNAQRYSFDESKGMISCSTIFIRFDWIRWYNMNTLDIHMINSRTQKRTV